MKKGQFLFWIEITDSFGGVVKLCREKTLPLCILDKVIYDNIFSINLMILKKILIKNILEIITTYINMKVMNIKIKAFENRAWDVHIRFIWFIYLYMEVIKTNDNCRRKKYDFGTIACRKRRSY